MAEKASELQAENDDGQQVHVMPRRDLDSPQEQVGRGSQHWSNLLTVGSCCSSRKRGKEAPREEETADHGKNK